MGYKMAQPANSVPLVDQDRLTIEARLTRLEVMNKHALQTMKEMKDDVSAIAASLSELRGELKGRRLVNGDSAAGTSNALVLKYVIVALTSALLSLVGVKLATGGV